MNDGELRVHVERGLENLRREFADKITAEHVTSIGNDRFERLIQDAKIIDFIPLLVYRETREALLVSQPDEFATQERGATRLKPGKRSFEQDNFE